MKNYWQPPIDRWIINENQSDSSSAIGASFDTYGKSNFPKTTTYMQSNANNTFRGENPYGASDMDEEEYFDKLQTPYKGIETLKELKNQINQVLEKMLSLLKSERKDVYRPYEMTNDPFEMILTMIDDPELKTMLKIASDEIKKRHVKA